MQLIIRDLIYRSPLYALLDYGDGRLRTVPVSDLCAVELFDAFWQLVQNA